MEFMRKLMRLPVRGDDVDVLLKFNHDLDVYEYEYWASCSLKSSIWRLELTLWPNWIVNRGQAYFFLCNGRKGPSQPLIEHDTHRT